MLRPYQQTAVKKILGFMSRSVDPCLLEAATGSGKSHIVAAVAEWVNEKSGKKVLCLAPSRELTEQNYGKFLATGKPASYYSASLGKSLAHDVIFGTPGTVLNGIKKFGSNFAAVIVDEAHGVTPTVMAIIEEIRKLNPQVRVVGLTATPYRLGSGYIFNFWPDGKKNTEDDCLDPYFHTLVHSIPAIELIEQGYLTNPTVNVQSVGYDTSGLKLNSMGKFSSSDVDHAFVGRGRLTSRIVEELVSLARNRNGVIIFASTVSHADEILESLPRGISRIITGATKKKERIKIIADFKAQKYKYLVNVSVLTTGFDASHIDVVAFMRATESVGLMQQMIGRGLRLHDGKKDCLVLDYAENIERHCPDGDVFAPEITARKQGSEKTYINSECGGCGFINNFSSRPNPDEFEVDRQGYFMDLNGQRIKTESDVEIPAHYGRRCEAEHVVSGRHVRCNHRWSSKECPDCGADNDIAARRCHACSCEIVDPNEKLRLEYERIKLDPRSLSTDKIVAWKTMRWTAKSGRVTVKIDFVTSFRTFPLWFMPASLKEWNLLCLATVGRSHLTVDEFMSKNKTMPTTITSRKDGKFYKVYAFNKPIDKDPSL
jgi:DNA repair protein RadD